MNSSDDTRNPVERLAENYLDRKRRGERPTLQEYMDRHPELAEEIRDLFPALLMMENLGESSGVSTGSLAAASGTANGIRLERLGDYRILGEIGRGGMGVVYEAEQVSLGRRVALKILSAGSLQDQKQVRRFEREARAAARLHHTNIVPVFGVGCHEGHHYFVMQFIAGLSLDVVLDDVRLLRQAKSKASPITRHAPGASRHASLTAADVAGSMINGTFPADARLAGDASATEPFSGESPVPRNCQSADTRSKPPLGTSVLSSSDPDRQYYRSVARIGIQVAEALDYANRQGILHRDVKPSNLLLDNHGNVWVADFGLAKTTEAEDLTHTGDILGTIRYMAPERFSGLCDARSDVYSLGLTLFELTALRPAFEASDRHRLMDRVLHEEPERLRKLAPTVPRDLETIIAKAMAREPALRYSTALALADDLRRFVEDRPIQARRVSAPERLARWCRRNKTLAASIGVAATALVIAAAVSLLYARRQARYAADQAAAKQQVARLANDLKASLQVSDRRRITLTSERARTNFERGQGACERGDIGPGMLYFIESWRSALEAGDSALAGAARASLSAWRHQAPKLLRQFPGSSNRTWRVALSPDGRVLALATTDGVEIWDLTTGELIGPPLTHPDELYDVAFSPDSKTLLTGCADKSARLWNLATLSPIGSPFVSRDTVTRVAFHPDGRTVITGNNDGKVQFWDVHSGAAIGRPLQLRSHVGSVSFCPDGKTVLTCDHEGARLWDFGTGTPTGVEFGPHKMAHEAVMSPDGKTVLTGSTDQTARLWDAANGSPAATPLAHHGTVYCVAFSPDGKTVLTGSTDQTARLWDAATGDALGMPSPHHGRANDVKYTPDGKCVLTVTHDGSPRLWDATAGGPRIGRPIFHQTAVYALAFRPDGKAVMTGTADGTVQIWDSFTGSPIGVPFKHPGSIAALAFSPDGGIVLIAGNDGTVRLWDAATHEPVSAPLKHPADLCSVAFSHEGKTVVTGCGDGTARLWDVASGKPLRQFHAQNGHFQRVQFSSDDKFVLTVGKPYAVRLWDAATGISMGPEIQTGGFTSAATLSRDGKTVMTASYAGFQSWDATTGQAIGPIARGATTIIAATFSPDGQRILFCSDEASARLWDVSTGRQFGPPLPHQTRIQAAELSPDGRTAFTTTGDNIALLWDISELPDDLPRVECWVNARIGLELDKEGQVKPLDEPAWQERNQRLATLGGTPENADSRWRLDPVLFGPDPTARAKAWIARKFWTEAEAAYDEAVLARPLDGTVLLERARFHESRSVRAKAERDFAKAWAMGSRDPKLIDSIAASDSLFRRAVAESPQAAAPLLALHAKAMVSQSRWQAAATDFAQELDLLPRDRIYHSPRSKRALEMARSALAYDELLKLRPDDGHLWCVRGRLRARRDNWEGAAADFARGIKSAPPDSEEWFEHACLRLIIGDTEGCEAFVKEMQRREGRTSNPFVAFVLARTCVQTAEPIVESQQVIRWAESAVRDSRLPWYLATLGAAHYRAGNFEQAIKSLEEANRAYIVGRYSTDPDLDTRVLLAMAQMRLGRTQAAHESMRKFQQAFERAEHAKIDGVIAVSATDWLPVQLLRVEAEALILYDPVFPINPFTQ